MSSGERDSRRRRPSTENPRTLTWGRSIAPTTSCPAKEPGYHQYARTRPGMRTAASSKAWWALAPPRVPRSRRSPLRCGELSCSASEPCLVVGTGHRHRVGCGACARRPDHAGSGRAFRPALIVNPIRPIRRATVRGVPAVVTSTRLRRIPQHRHAQFADSTWLRRALPRDRTQHLCPAIFVIHASAAGIAGRRPADLEASGTASVPWTLETGARASQLYTPRCHPAHGQRLHASSSDPRTRRNLEAFPRAVGCPDPAFPACPLSCRRVRR